MADKWETFTEDVPYVLTVLVIVAILTIFIRKWMNNPWKKDNSWTKELSNSRVSGSRAQSAPLKNIWDERKKNGSTAADANVQRTDADGKPFGSSYYYAHNSLRKTGGYADGLRMEDYQMETPRLLSKNGVSYVQSSKSLGESCKSSTTNSKSTRILTSPAERESFIPINKYLWDDPGDAKGIGTIRIEQLTDGLSWKDADISDIQIKVSDNLCLTVSVKTKDGMIYRLHIPELYGEVREVRKVEKANRLLLRLCKQNENEKGKKSLNKLKSWPTPYKKAF